MREIGDFGNNERLAQRKIDALGYVKSHICFINDPTWIECLRSRLALTKYLEYAKKIEDEEAVNDKLEEEGELATLLPEAVHAYLSCREGGKPGRNFTKKHINAILLLCYSLRVSGKKYMMLAALDEAV